MTYTDDHLLLAWGGRMPGDEQWTNTLRMRPQALGLPEQTVLDGWLQGGFKDALSAFWGAISNNIGAGTWLDWMKANAVDTTGHYRDPTTNRYDFPTPVQGTSVVPPNQLSYVISTLTGIPRGRAHIGRFFIPATSGLAISATTGLVTSDVSTVYLNDAATFLNALNDTASFATIQRAVCAVMSSLGTGTTYTVTGVGGGLVVDTQRRRRASLEENRIEVNL